MGGSFSTVEYREQIIKFQSNLLTHEDDEKIKHFLMVSDDFYNVFTASVLEDFRKIKEEKVDNLIYLLSYV
jgi:hypothetical protein